MAVWSRQLPLPLVWEVVKPRTLHCKRLAPTIKRRREKAKGFIMGGFYPLPSGRGVHRPTQEERFLAMTVRGIVMFHDDIYKVNIV